MHVPKDSLASPQRPADARPEGAPPDARTPLYRGSAADRGEPNVAHELCFRVDSALRVTGTSHWPAHPARGLQTRSFALRGRCDATGRIEFVDDAPEHLAGFRRGVYVGRLQPETGRFAGQYYEESEQGRELFYWGAWTACLSTP